MREKLNKKREELVKKARSLYGEQVSSGIFNGWLSCQDELLPLIEEMREALEFYAASWEVGTLGKELVARPFESNLDFIEVHCLAHKALEKLKKWEES